MAIAMMLLFFLLIIYGWRYQRRSASELSSRNVNRFIGRNSGLSAQHAHRLRVATNAVNDRGLAGDIVGARLAFRRRLYLFIDFFCVRFHSGADGRDHP
jgi:hypothetical protein